MNGMDAYRHTDTRTYLTLSGRLLCQPPSLGGVGNLGEPGGGVVTGEGRGGGSTHEHNRVSSQLTAAVAQSQAGPQGTAHRPVHKLLLNS